MTQQKIQIRGARQHNLNNVNLDIPKGLLTVITGPSGCGKSSLAFHTLYAEGQRRYLECLGTNAQKTLRTLEKPAFDFIDGLNPTIALQQDDVRPPRGTTVAMMSEVYDYLRLLYGTIGIPHDPVNNTPLERLTSPEIISRLLDSPERTKLIILAPLSSATLTDIDYLKDDLRRQGFVRVAINAKLYNIEDSWPPSENISVVIDRLMVRDGVESRLADSLEIALQISPSGASALIQELGNTSWSEASFTTGYHNPATGFHLPLLDAHCFSYGNQSTQCPTCNGLGRIDNTPCPTCQGSRLRSDYSVVQLPIGSSHLTLHELLSQSVTECVASISQLVIPSHLQSVVVEIQTQIQRRLSFLSEVGLHYLHLDQWAAELSAGEHQRLRLASQLGAGLSGVLYVLDEPSRGLYHSDTELLIQSLHKLRDAGNTIVIVEHDPTLIAAADWIIDLGPGAGRHGGNVIAAGSPSELLEDSSSPTGRWMRLLSDHYQPKILHPAPRTAQTPFLSIANAHLHTLKNIDVKIALGAMTTVEGPSGCGKSTLISKTLGSYALHKLNKAAPFTPHAEISGLDHFNKAVVIDQSPIGRSPRSSAATYTGIFDQIRTLFSNLPLSKQRGYQASRFSFNVKGGRCEKCLGAGKLKIPLQFMSDAYVTCDACDGTRYNRETLEIRYKGKNIADVLNSSIEENLEHFGANPKLAHPLECLVKVGLGYLLLGQPAHTLSGGEAQRVKIATELSKAPSEIAQSVSSRGTLFLLDEPTRGLHFQDVEVLANALRSLLIGNNTIIAIEHNQQFIAYADYRIKMGHAGGDKGGRIL